MQAKSWMCLGALVVAATPSFALAPVVNDPSYQAQTQAANAPKPPSANTMYQLLNRIEQLQREVQQLTGKVEEQSYQNAELKKRLATLYDDFDQRMRAVEDKLSGATPPVNGLDSDNSGNLDASPSLDEPQATVTDESSTKLDPEAAPAVTPAPAASPKPADSAPKPPESGTSEAESQEFREAYDALRNGRTEQSIAAFNAFLSHYPDGSQAGVAQYWLGEAYRVNQDANSARKAFNTLIERYPNHAKVPDALLKLGYVEITMKDPTKARAYLNRVIEQFPNSTAAGYAKKKLSALDQAKP